jgi:hypothetical protein
MDEHRFRTFRVVLGRMNAATIRDSDHQRTGKATPRAITHTADVIDNLVESWIEKAHELNFSHRAQVGNRHAYRHAHDAGLRNRRVHDPFGAVKCL